MYSSKTGMLVQNEHNKQFTESKQLYILLIVGKRKLCEQTKT